MKEIWVEKYRPKTLDEIVGQDEIVERLKAYRDSKNLPHLLFAGGATTTILNPIDAVLAALRLRLGPGETGR